MLRVKPALQKKKAGTRIPWLIYLQFELISYSQTGMVALQSPGHDETLVVRGVATQQIFQLTQTLWSYKRKQMPQMINDTDTRSFWLSGRARTGKCVGKLGFSRLLLSLYLLLAQRFGTLFSIFRVSFFILTFILRLQVRVSIVFFFTAAPLFFFFFFLLIIFFIFILIL